MKLYYDECEICRSPKNNHGICTGHKPTSDEDYDRPDRIVVANDTGNFIRQEYINEYGNEIWR